MPPRCPGERKLSTETDSARPADPGLQALVMLLRFQGVAANPRQIRHLLGMARIGVPETLRCAKDLGLQARAYRPDPTRLATPPLPAVPPGRAAGFLVAAKASEHKALRPTQP